MSREKKTYWIDAELGGYYPAVHDFQWEHCFLVVRFSTTCLSVENKRNGVETK